MPNTEIKVFESRLKMPFMYLPVRSTLISFNDKSLLFSPLPDLKESDMKSENVTDIIAPNLFHHLAGLY